ncbi:MAG: hypothetical protein DRH03_01275 [Deltaproteobacteria bacterium]|nr:MAG: hypothetical protein DRH03_01275 [Deltaproteobacteria bacterium]
MKKLFLLVMALIMVAGVSSLRPDHCLAQSLYEYYADASAGSLDKETQAMGRELRKTFSQKNIHINQQKIDFATYFTNLKKAVLYGNKLSTYSQYRKDLDFARDNELFKGLPATPRDQVSGKEMLSRKEFVAEKYERTKGNVEDEIEIYIDLLTLSLDVCESMSVNDLSGFIELKENRNQILKWQQSEEFAAYQERSTDLNQAWPDIEKRIATQCTLWQDRPVTPDAPIISASLVNAL